MEITIHGVTLEVSYKSYSTNEFTYPPQDYTVVEDLEIVKVISINDTTMLEDYGVEDEDLLDEMYLFSDKIKQLIAYNIDNQCYADVVT